jgi:hypothetical protein
MTFENNIKIFNSVKECAEYIQITTNRVSEVLTGKKTSYKNHKFQYLEKT